jgi:hypothetical protein
LIKPMSRAWIFSMKKHFHFLCVCVHLIHINNTIGKMMLKRETEREVNFQYCVVLFCLDVDMMMFRSVNILWRSFPNSKNRWNFHLCWLLYEHLGGCFKDSLQIHRPLKFNRISQRKFYALVRDLRNKNK